MYVKVHTSVKKGIYRFINVDKDVRGHTLMERVQQGVQVLSPKKVASIVKASQNKL